MILLGILHLCLDSLDLFYYAIIQVPPSQEKLTMFSLLCDFTNQ